MTLTDYRTLGRSGLVVSPLSLGTMTFGNTSWGSPDDVSKDIFNTYVDAGGNAIDTADVYAKGRSEELVGAFIAERKLRDQIVLATKFTFHTEKGNPNPHAGGNGRKHIYQALEASLKRLKTDYIDLYWLHIWDMVTPVEEVLQTLGDLVRAGRIRYFAFSNVPAWYMAKAATLAQAHGVPGPVGMQLEYSLVARGIESEHVPAARELGLGVMPWSPLAGGFLAGKYEREEAGASGEGRLSKSNPFQGPFTKFTERNWQILDTLEEVAAEVERPSAQVALAWGLAQPGISSTIIGASKLAQLESNVAALELDLSREQMQKLNEASAPESPLFTNDLKRLLFGGVDVLSWR